MKKTENKGLILVYVIFLLTVGVILGLVVFNNSYLFYNNIEYRSYSDKLYSNIKNKSDLSIKLDKFYNSNGTGFIDDISCPNSVTMSGSTNSGTVSTSLIYNSGSVYCNGSYLSNNLDIIFNSTYTDFSSADYNGSIVTLVNGVGTSLFTDPDSTQISFSTSGLGGIDDIDDDFNSDDYKVGSTGSTLYPNGYIDDDIIARKNIYGNLIVGDKYINIFWNNYKINSFISDNINNNDSYHEKIGEVNSGYIRLDIDGNYDLKLVKFNKNRFIDNSELIPIETLEGLNLSGSGYIQNNSGTLSTGITKTGNEYIFDFMSNDYALFLKNLGENSLIYNISSETTTGTGIYINPIDDSGENIEYLGSDIITDEEGNFIYEQFIVTKEK